MERETISDEVTPLHEEALCQMEVFNDQPLKLQILKKA